MKLHNSHSVYITTLIYNQYNFSHAQEASTMYIVSRKIGNIPPWQRGQEAVAYGPYTLFQIDSFQNRVQGNT